MKVLLISFVVGVAVGLIYGLIRVKSPAPPIVALLGLFGMVLGEQAADWLYAKRAANDGPATALVSHAPGIASRAADLPSKND
jgi:XapX domain-containing protein